MFRGDEERLVRVVIGIDGTAVGGPDGDGGAVGGRGVVSLDGVHATQHRWPPRDFAVT